MRYSFLVLGLISALPQTGHAQIVGEVPKVTFPDPKKYARGFYAEGQVGLVAYFGDMGQNASPGPLFAARLGYDLTRWLSLGLHAGGSASAANTPPPQNGQWFQTYFYSAEARGQLQIRRFGLYLGIGGGGVTLSSNILDAVGVTQNRGTTSLLLTAAAGLDIHTLNRHYSAGVDIEYAWLANFNSAHALMFATFLRYTR